MFLGSLSPHSAYALDFSLLGAVTQSNYSLSTTPSTQSSSGTAFGVGGTVGVDLNPFFSLESGLLFLTHSFSTFTGAVTQNYTNKYIDVPLLLRFVPFSLVSFSLGGYYGVLSAASIETLVSNVTTAQIGNGSNDYGLLGGVGIRLPLASLLKVRLDILYQYGFANLSSNSATTQRSRNVDIFVGLMLDIW